MGNLQDARRYTTVNWHVVQLVRPGTRVLDVGCATGRLGEVLSERKQCRCDGLERDAAAAALAAPHYDRITVVDLDDPALDSKLPWQDAQFDHIVFADVLEHLREPERAVGVLMRFLRPGGTVLCGLPNVAFWRKRLMLFMGQWTYEDVGICDRTHLHFYTRQSGLELVERCGLHVTKVLDVGVDGRYGPIKRNAPSLFAGGFVYEGLRRAP